jgi:F-type H+-transporting ATPase subunit a
MFRGKKGLILLLVGALILADILTPFRVRQIVVRLAPEVVFQIGGFKITNTLLTSWLAMAILVVLAVFARRKLVDVPRALSLQNIVEAVVEALYAFMQRIVGAHARAFFPVVGTLFFFILTSNWLGLLPGFGSVGLWEEQGGQRIFMPLLKSPTADLNTTIALACCAVISLQVYGVHFRGLAGYTSRFLAVGRLAQFLRLVARGEKPSLSLLFRGFLDLFIGLMELFEDLTKVLSFSFRLFGNVFGAEVLLAVIAFLVPYVISIPFMALEIFGGFIQAFIFAVLTTAFLGAVTSHSAGVEAEDANLISSAADQTTTFV